jgi:CDP-diacylglycerol--glycerol-3-phosphate 3-phosphatidyltransferase
MNIPNYLTLVRIFSIPVFVFLFYLPFKWSHTVTAILFALAAITDWLDGYLARSWDQTSRFGAFLDPVADKLIVVTALVLIVGERNIPFLAIPAAIIIGREIVVSALREWMAELGKRTSVAVSIVGKVKTLIQMIALVMLLAYQPGDKWLGLFGIILFYLAAVLTLWSMVMYLQVAWPELTWSEQSEVSE